MSPVPLEEFEVFASGRTFDDAKAAALKEARERLGGGTIATTPESMKDLSCWRLLSVRAHTAGFDRVEVTAWLVFGDEKVYALLERRAS